MVGFKVHVWTWFHGLVGEFPDYGHPVVHLSVRSSSCLVHLASEDQVNPCAGADNEPRLMTAGTNWFTEAEKRLKMRRGFISSPMSLRLNVSEKVFWSWTEVCDNLWLNSLIMTEAEVLYVFQVSDLFETRWSWHEPEQWLGTTSFIFTKSYPWLDILTDCVP